MDRALPKGQSIRINRTNEERAEAVLKLQRRAALGDVAAQTKFERVMKLLGRARSEALKHD